MKLQTIVTSIALGLSVAALSGCATTQGPNNFTRSEAGRTQTVEAGTVTAVRDVTIQNEGSNVATATGAVLGGVAGNSMGGGRGRTATTVAGAAAGGAAGYALSQSSHPGVEVTVQLDSGRTIAVVQDGSSKQFRVGDRVNVASDGVTARVTRAH